MYIYFSSCNVFENGCIYIYILKLTGDEKGMRKLIPKTIKITERQNLIVFTLIKSS